MPFGTLGARSGFPLLLRPVLIVRSFGPVADFSTKFPTRCSLVSMSRFETSTSLSIFLSSRSRSSARRLRAVISASRCARSSASCRTSATAPVLAMICWMCSSLARFRAPGTSFVESLGESSNSAVRPREDALRCIKVWTIEGAWVEVLRGVWGAEPV